MANVSRVNGFKPVKNANGSPWNGQLTKYYVASGASGAIGIGDLVSLAGGASPDGIRTVAKTAVGAAAIGAVVNIDFDPTDLNTPNYRPAGTVRFVYVADDPGTVYEAQISGTFDAGDIGMNANHADAGVSTTTGVSGETVNVDTAAVTATLTLKILDFKQSPDNELATAAKVLVKVNNHQMAPNTAGV